MLVVYTMLFDACYTMLIHILIDEPCGEYNIGNAWYIIGHQLFAGQSLIPSKVKLKNKEVFND